MFTEPKTGGAPNTGATRRVASVRYVLPPASSWHPSPSDTQELPRTEVCISLCGERRKSRRHSLLFSNRREGSVDLLDASISAEYPRMKNSPVRHAQAVVPTANGRLERSREYTAFDPLGKLQAAKSNRLVTAGASGSLENRSHPRRGRADVIIAVATWGSACSAKLACIGSKASRRAVTLLGVMSLLSACAHNVLYDENRDKQGQEAKKAVAEARLAGAIVSLEKTFAELAAREEASVRDRASYLFDLELRTISRAPSLASKFDEQEGIDGLMTVVKARLTKLGMSKTTDEQFKELRTLDTLMREETSILEANLIEFRGTVGHRFESCEAIYAASADPSQKSEVASDRFRATIAADRLTLVPLKFPMLIESCKEIDEVLAKRNKFFDRDGDVKALYGRIDRIEREIVAYEVAQRKAREELGKAIAEFRKSGVEAATKPGQPSKLESLEQRAQSLRDVVQIIGAGGSVLGLAGAHVVAAEKLKHLEAILGAIAGSPSEGKVTLSVDEQVSIAIVRDLPALADEADKLLKDARKPRLVPFLAAIDYQKLVLQGFEAAQGTKRKQADAARNQLQAMLNEVAALVRVLHPLAKNKSWAERSISDLDRTLSGSEKVEFYRALATYADEVQQFRIETAVWAVREQAAQYEEGLVRSKFAAAQWDGLIDTMATVLADYHAAGIKRADLAEFFKALGLVAIGVGVAL